MDIFQQMAWRNGVSESMKSGSTIGAKPSIILGDLSITREQNGDVEFRTFDATAKNILTAEQAMSLLEWLYQQRDELYQLVQHGKQAEQKPPADLSFLEMEDERGVYRIVGQDAAGQDIKRYLAQEEITLPDRCPYCKMAECICQEALCDECGMAPCMCEDPDADEEL